MGFHSTASYSGKAIYQRDWRLWGLRAADKICMGGKSPMAFVVFIVLRILLLWLEGLRKSFKPVYALGGFS